MPSIFVKSYIKAAQFTVIAELNKVIIEFKISSN